MPTERFTVAIEQELLRRFDALLPQRGGPNRSEGVRDLIRRRLVEAGLEVGDTPGGVTWQFSENRGDDPRAAGPG